ncbi:oligopeptidase A [Gynuella sunshinyii]|uniref:oligopeptidase A n=1 Tax=Gynuella sunshinyii YC6258 TaxID=1445510 RepID=A0A0C5UZQ5_9GAMM|nr:oligopeptidase A [Gynuella sunshinyii]AJQ92760.1 Zn-dependent oligopeptidase [Gynuella sunshinyii YC6258]
MSNPLLESHRLPPFSRIRAEHVVPAIGQLIEQNRAEINELVNSPETPDWETFLNPIQQLTDRLEQAWSPIGHLAYVKDSEELREAYKQALEMMSAYSTEFYQNEGLCRKYQQIDLDKLDRPARKAVENALLDFKLSGISLPQEQRSRYAEIAQRLSKLGSQFQENVLDATQGWSKHIIDQKDLAGLPESALATLAQNAKNKGKDGWLITLEFPSYLPVMTYADNRSLRREVATAFSTRASDQGPNAGQWNNAAVMAEILDLRTEEADLLGYGNYSELSLAKKMAKSPKQVLDFLNELADKSYPQAGEEFAELTAYARQNLGVSKLDPWDVAYASEKLKQHSYSISQEELKPYFPVNRVIDGLFQTAQRLFAVEFREQQDFDTYHPDVKLFEITSQGEHIASFYLDLYAREGKRGGAWMDVCRSRIPGQLPVAYLTCNFTAPVGDKPALLTHMEVTTLFHEFGHGIHHMLTQVEVSAVGGINGVAWDAVELPSQFMENFCYEPEALAFISGHFETGEPLPKDLLDKMLAAKNFQSAMQTVRQLEFALFDFELHTQYRHGHPEWIRTVIDSVRDRVCVVPVLPENRFENSFSHIFGGGYAAGYYSYKWAEVLSADAFSRFEEEGVFNAETGLSFRREILEKGGSEDAMTLFKNFRGREPSVDALLRHSGIKAA